MGKDEKCCLNCKIFWDKEHGCDECRFEHKDRPSLFYQITQSPEVLAKKFVIKERNQFGGSFYKSILLVNENGNYLEFCSREKAEAETVAKLKEVADA